MALEDKLIKNLIDMIENCSKLRKMIKTSNLMEEPEMMIGVKVLPNPKYPWAHFLDDQPLRLV